MNLTTGDAVTVCPLVDGIGPIAAWVEVRHAAGLVGMHIVAMAIDGSGVVRMLFEGDEGRIWARGHGPDVAAVLLLTRSGMIVSSRLADVGDKITVAKALNERRYETVLYAAALDLLVTPGRAHVDVLHDYDEGTLWERGWTDGESLRAAWLLCQSYRSAQE